MLLASHSFNLYKHIKILCKQSDQKLKIVIKVIRKKVQQTAFQTRCFYTFCFIDELRVDVFQWTDTMHTTKCHQRALSLTLTSDHSKSTNNVFNVAADCFFTRQQQYQIIIQSRKKG
jgi:hypothetical protein